MAPAREVEFGRLQLASIVHQIETQNKIGLLTIDQGEQQIKLYFQDGEMVSIGPPKGERSLGTQLLEAGIISQHDLQLALIAMDMQQEKDAPVRDGDMRMALILTELGLVNREQLHTWAQQKATQMLQDLFTQVEGNIHFKEGIHPPDQRSLFALRITSLLPSFFHQHPATPAPGTLESDQEKSPHKLTHSLSTESDGTIIAEGVPSIAFKHKAISLATPSPSSLLLSTSESPTILRDSQHPYRIRQRISTGSESPTVLQRAIKLSTAAHAIVTTPIDDLMTTLGLPAIRNKAVVHWEQFLLIALLLVTLLSHSVNMFHFPYYYDDEGTYMAQAWAVVHLGKLAPYTYTYDHAPFGWLLIAVWTFLTGGFHTFGAAINSGRVLMLVLQVGSTFMLYRIARNMSRSVTIAVIVSLLFALSPYGIYFHRRVLIDNIATFWMLLSIFLLVSQRLTLKRVWFSALALGISMLSKETTAVLIPAMAYLVFLRSDRSNRRFATIGWLAIITSFLSLYIFVAILNDKFFPAGTLFGGNAPHVSLIDTFKYQASRGRDGGLFDLQSGFWQLTRQWMQDDPMLVIGGSICAILSVITIKWQRLAGTIGIMTLFLWAFLGRGGETLDFYLIPLLPLLALNIGLVLEGIANGLKHFKRITISSKSLAGRAIQLATIAVCLITIPLGYSSLSLGLRQNHTQLWTGSQTLAEQEAIDWVKGHISPKSRILIDDYMWTDLHDTDNPALTYPLAHYYWKVDRDPAIGNTIFHNDWHNVDYIVTTPDMLRDAHNEKMTLVEQALTHSTVITQFNTGSWPITIRQVVSKAKTVTPPSKAIPSKATQHSAHR